MKRWIRSSALLGFLIATALILSWSTGGPAMPNLPPWKVIGERLSSTYLPAEAITRVLGLLGWGLWFYIVGSLMLRAQAHLAARIGLPGAGRLVRLSDTVTPPQLRRLFDLALGGALVLSALTGPKYSTGKPAISRAPMVAIHSNGSAPTGGTTSLLVGSQSPTRTYEVKPGDSLWRIAERELGGGLRWREIFELNLGRQMGDGRRLEKSRLIHPGWQLLLPVALEDQDELPPIISSLASSPAPSQPAVPANIERINEKDPGKKTAAPRVIRVELPDGTAMAGSFAAGILAAAALGRLRRRRILDPGDRTPFQTGAPNVDTIRRTRVDPSIDVIGSISEAVVRTCARELGEVPNVVAAWEGAEATTVLLKTESERLPKTSIDPTGQQIAFDRRGPHVRALVTGPSVARVRRSAFAAADGVLVPAGFTEAGTLYVPLLGGPLCIAGTGAEGLGETLILAAWTRLGPSTLKVMVSESVGVLSDVNSVERFSSEDIDRVVSDLQVEALRRKRLFAEEGVDSFAPHVLENPDDQLPVILVVIEAAAASQVFRQMDWESLDVGISILILGDGVDGSRRIIAEESGSVAELVGLEALRFENAVLAPDILTEIMGVIGQADCDPVVRGTGSSSRSVETGERPTDALVISLEEEASSSLEERGSNGESDPESPVALGEAPFKEEPFSEYVAPALDSEIVSRISCLGGWRIEVEGREVEGELLQKGRELLALLIAHPRGLTRDRIIETLWPESDLDGKTALFQKYASTVRNVLRGKKQSAKMIGKSGDVYRFEFERAWVDVAAFEESVKRAKNASDPVPDLTAAIDLYRGDFCQDIYYDWAEEIRVHLRNLYVNATLRLAEFLDENQEFEKAVQVIDRAIAIEKYAEVLFVKAMEIEAKLHRRDAIVRRFHRLEQLLAEDLELEPAEETVQSFNSLARRLVPSAR